MYQIHRTDALKATLHNLNREIKTRILSQREERWHRNIRSIQNGKENVWKFIKRRKGKNENHILALEANDRKYTSLEGKLNLMVDTYKNFTEQTHEMSDEDTKRMVTQRYEIILNSNHKTPADAQTCPQEIKRTINRMRPMKAPGKDNQIYYIYKDA